MTKLLLTCGLLAALTACASNQPASSSASSSPAASGGVATAAATAAPTAQSATVATTAAKPQQAKLVCDDEEQIGSHFHQRVCLTPEQVEARKKAARDMMSNLPGGNGGCANNGCGSSGGPPSR